MYSKIVVPLDGSPTAESILGEIEGLAIKLGAAVVLFQSVPSLADTMTGSHIALDVATEALEEAKKEARLYLEKTAERLRAAGVNVNIHVGEGPPAATLLSYSRNEHVSLVAMTTHGRSGLARTILGSVADEVMRHSHLPVLVVRPPE